MSHSQFVQHGPAVPAPASLRGIYRCRRRIGGCAAYFAKDSRGQLVAPGVRIVQPDERETLVVVELKALLDAADPVRPHLRLVKGDGPPTLRSVVAAWSHETFAALVSRPPVVPRAGPAHQ